MNSDGNSATNVGLACRDGAVLQVAEAVALAYEACRQVNDGMAARIPWDPLELEITPGGQVIVNAAGPMWAPGPPLGALLQALLPAQGASDALRSLPARLIDSPAPPGSRLDDQLAILKFHLGGSTESTLRTLGARLGGASDFDWDASLNEPAVAPAIVAPVPSPVVASPVVAARVAAAPVTARHRALWPAAALVLLAVSGYAGYRVTQQRIPSGAGHEAPSAVATAAPAAVAEAPQPVSDPPRITRAIPEASPLQLDVQGGAFSPSFSADGSSLFFHLGRERGQLMQVALGDEHRGPARAVGYETGRNFHVRPSPDGEWIAFDSDRDGVRGVFVARGDGSGMERVSGPGFAAVPSWSPDMKWLAFVRGEPSRPRVWNLWLRDVTSGDLRRVSDFRSGQVWSASFFPDGHSICYSHDNEIIVTDLRSGTSKTFETPVHGRLARTPAVSPDGSRIVFQVLGDGIWMIDVATGAMRRVSDDGSAEEFAWDPTGRRIAYHSRRDGQWRIWVMTL